MVRTPALTVHFCTPTDFQNRRHSDTLLIVMHDPSLKDGKIWECPRCASLLHRPLTFLFYKTLASPCLRGVGRTLSSSTAKAFQLRLLFRQLTLLYAMHALQWAEQSSSLATRRSYGTSVHFPSKSSWILESHSTTSLVQSPSWTSRSAFYVTPWLQISICTSCNCCAILLAPTRTASMPP